MHKKHPALIGFLQALSIAVYCGLIALFLKFGKVISPQLPEFWGAVMMLLLLVVSAGITGLLVFGYPVILLLEKEVKRALHIIAHTFLFSIIVITIVLIIISLI